MSAPSDIVRRAIDYTHGAVVEHSNDIVQNVVVGRELVCERTEVERLLAIGVAGAVGAVSGAVASLPIAGPLNQIPLAGQIASGVVAAGYSAVVSVESVTHARALLDIEQSMCDEIEKAKKRANERFKDHCFGLMTDLSERISKVDDEIAKVPSLGIIDNVERNEYVSLLTDEKNISHIAWSRILKAIGVKENEIDLNKKKQLDLIEYKKKNVPSYQYEYRVPASLSQFVSVLSAPSSSGGSGLSSRDVMRNINSPQSASGSHSSVSLNRANNQAYDAFMRRDRVGLTSSTQQSPAERLHAQRETLTRMANGENAIRADLVRRLNALLNPVSVQVQQPTTAAQSAAPLIISRSAVIPTPPPVSIVASVSNHGFYVGFRANFGGSASGRRW